MAWKARRRASHVVAGLLVLAPGLGAAPPQTQGPEPAPVITVNLPDLAEFMRTVEAHIPEYTGAHRAVLSEVERPAVERAVQLLDRRLGAALPGDDRWWLCAKRAECFVLIAEDERSREKSRYRKGPTSDSGRDALDAQWLAVEADPEQAWSRYGVGVALVRVGRPVEARHWLRKALEAERGRDEFLEFKVREWLVQAALIEFDWAGAERLQEEFFREYGNEWDKRNARIDLLLRKRDFAAVLSEARALTEHELWREEPAAHEIVGHTALLMGRRAEAQAAFVCAFELAREPEGMVYPALWSWISAGTDTEREGARERIVGLLAGAELGGWERSLLARFADAKPWSELVPPVSADDEVERRLAAGEAARELLAEDAFYRAAWVWHLFEAESTESGRERLTQRLRSVLRGAVHAWGPEMNWEREQARVWLAELAGAVKAKRGLLEQVQWRRGAMQGSGPPEPLEELAACTKATVWRGAERVHAGPVSEAGVELRIGDLVQYGVPCRWENWHWRWSHEEFVVWE